MPVILELPTYLPEPIADAEAKPSQLLRLHITRDESGVKLTIQCGFSMASLFETTDMPHSVCGLRCHQFKAGVFDGMPQADADGRTLVTWNKTTAGSILYDRSYINLSMLAVDGLSEGVIFVDKLNPHSAKQLNLCATTIRDAVKWIYNNHLRPANVCVEMNIKEVGL